MRKSLSISAIVVNHVVVLDPFNPSLAGVIQRFRHPGIGTGAGCSARRRRRSGRPNAGLGSVVAVGGSEWGLTPIGLH